jgi:membrane-associated phospholipid phosphatase
MAWNRLFYILVAPFILFTLGMSIIYEQSTLFAMFNPPHTYFTDRLFFVMTGFGNAIYLGILGIVFLMLRSEPFWSRFTHLLTSFLLSSLVVVIAKNAFFAEVPRPVVVMGADALQMVKGVDICSWRSFPSGHTTTAFALIAVLAIGQNKLQTVLWALFALAVGYSRIYLNQHFPIDVATGALIGLASGYTSYYLARRIYGSIKRPKRTVEEVAEL